ncbi:RCC1 domain-containing protein RUG3, mitochondrial isoform X1 [Vigna angularis]|uniref:RCC1 domain-containing protein RUG3, mitochondrial isoform X1 n=1 Tax=Phaseolus angularis TaxID=3914 RepID=UPI0022B423E1|nr:RCC1 domain-containing protein RUG3, mitochondrial isoform X1 [Vigna angularis]
MKPIFGCRHHHNIATLTRGLRHFSTTPKPPLLYTADTIAGNDAILQVLSWGRGASGQLGGGVEETRLYPSPVANLAVPKSSFSLAQTPGRLPAEKCRTPEVGISCGLFHSSLVAGGALWIWGKGDGGRLGFGHEHSLFVPTLNPHLDNLRSVALGGLHSVALTSAGEVFTCFQGLWWFWCTWTLSISPRVISEVGKRLLGGNYKTHCHQWNTYCSNHNIRFVLDIGELYTWGRDEGDGRLGLGPGRGPDHAGGLSIPSRVKELPYPVAAASCGGFFTMALTEDGQLWNWGANSNYELGRGDKTGGWKPRPIPSLENVKIIQIASGGYHSLALTGDGKVLSWGHGGQGQLGHGSVQNQKIPAVVEALSQEHIIYITCGGSSSAALTENGKLYMWGNANDSQLGVPGLPPIHPCPVEVNFLMDDDGLGPHKVLSVAIGASHAMCLALRESS